MNKITSKDIIEYCKTLGHAVIKDRNANTLYVKVQEWSNAQHSKFYTKENHTVCKFTLKGVHKHIDNTYWAVVPDITMDELKTLVDEGMKWRLKRDNKKLAKIINAL